MRKDKVYIIHGSKIVFGEPKDVTVSFVLKDELSLDYAISVVHPRDSFVKRIGREISGKKLREKPQTLEIILGVVEAPTFALIAWVANALEIGYRN